MQFLISLLGLSFFIAVAQSAHSIPTDDQSLLIRADEGGHHQLVKPANEDVEFNTELFPAAVKNSRFLKPTMAVLQKALESTAKDEHDEALVRCAPPKRARVQIPSPSCHSPLPLSGMKMQNSARRDDIPIPRVLFAIRVAGKMKSGILFS